MNSLRKLRIAAKYNLSLPLARKISRLLGSSQVTFVTEMRILKFPEEKVMDPQEKKLVEKERQEAIKKRASSREEKKKKSCMCVISRNLSTSIHNHECRKLSMARAHRPSITQKNFYM